MALIGDGGAGSPPAQEPPAIRRRSFSRALAALAGLARLRVGLLELPGVSSAAPRDRRAGGTRRRR